MWKGEEVTSISVSTVAGRQAALCGVPSWPGVTEVLQQDVTAAADDERKPLLVSENQRKEMRRKEIGMVPLVTFQRRPCPPKSTPLPLNGPRFRVALCS